MTIKLGVVMDPIGSIKFHKDSTLAMLLAARKRGWQLHYMEQGDLFLQDSRCHASLTRLEVRDDEVTGSPCQINKPHHLMTWTSY